MPEWDRLSDIHLWDLNENSTRFDEASAAPSDDDLKIQWIGTATIAGIVAFFTFLLMISILRVREVRNKSFNCYILSVVLPEFQFSLSCSITCALNAIHGRYMGEAMCGWQTWYAIFGFAASCWMNAVISNQLFVMLKLSHFSQRYTAPTIRHVAKQTLAVYTYAACLASLCTWNVFGVPFKGGIYQGYACLAKDYDDPSTIFFWLGFLPLCVLIPLVYVISCIIRIYRGGMLPPPGQRTTLYMYFSLIFVFVFMWLPFIVITFVWGPASPGVDSTWVLWIGAQFSHLQGLATVWTILFKSDIRAAFLGTISCGQLKLEQASRSSRPRSGSSRGTNNTGSTQPTRNVSGSILLNSMISQESRVSTENRFGPGLESINEILGSAPQAASREPRGGRGGGGDDETKPDKGNDLRASEKRHQDSVDDLERLEEGYLGESGVDSPRDNGHTALRVEKNSSDEEVVSINPASISNSSESRSISPSSICSLVEIELSRIQPSETQRMIFEDSVALGVSGVEVQVPAERDASASLLDGSDEIDLCSMIADCNPSEMQRIAFEDAVLLGMAGTDIVQTPSGEADGTILIGSDEKDYRRGACDLTNDEIITMIDRCQRSEMQQMIFEDSVTLGLAGSNVAEDIDWGKGSMKKSSLDGNESGEVSWNSLECRGDIDIDGIIAESLSLSSGPSEIQRVAFEDAVALGVGGKEMSHILASMNDDENKVS